MAVKDFIHSILKVHYSLETEKLGREREKKIYTSFANKFGA